VRFIAEDTTGLSLGFGFFLAVLGAALAVYETVKASR